MSHFPLELIFCSADHAKRDLEIFRALSLTCRGLRQYSQRNLLRRVGVGDADLCDDLCKLLIRNPNVQQYIRDVRLGNKLVGQLLGLAPNRPPLYLKGIPLNPWESVWIRIPPTARESFKNLISNLPVLESFIFTTTHAAFYKCLSFPNLPDLQSRVTRLEIRHADITHIHHENVLSFLENYQNLEILVIFDAEQRGHPLDVLQCPPGRKILPKLRDLKILWSIFAQSLFTWLLESLPPLRNLQVFGRSGVLGEWVDLEFMSKFLRKFNNLHTLTVDSRCYSRGEDLERICFVLRGQRDLKVLKLGHFKFQAVEGSDPWFSTALENVSSTSIHTIELALVFEDVFRDGSSTLDLFDWTDFRERLLGVRFPVLQVVRIHTIVYREAAVKEESLIEKIRHRLKRPGQKWALQFVANDRDYYPVVPSFR